MSSELRRRRFVCLCNTEQARKFYLELRNVRCGLKTAYARYLVPAMCIRSLVMLAWPRGEGNIFPTVRKQMKSLLPRQVCDFLSETCLPLLTQLRAVAKAGICETLRVSRAFPSSGRFNLVPDLLVILWRDLNIDRACVLFQIFEVLRAWDGNEVCGLVNHGSLPQQLHALTITLC
jgi:hypothetical protein